MKRILSLLLSLLLLFILISCSKNKTPLDSDSHNSIAAEDSELSSNSYLDQEISNMSSEEESDESSLPESQEDSSHDSSANSSSPSDSQVSSDHNSVPSVSSGETESRQPELPPKNESDLSSSVHIHSYTSQTINPTCTEEGYTKKVCSCGDVIKENFTEALGHSFDEWQVKEEATTSKKGLKERICRICQYRETQEIPKKTASSDVYSPTAAELEMLQYINRSRAEAGLSPLSFDTKRGLCADIRAKEIQQTFSHTRPNGKDCFSVLDELGLSFDHTAGENIQRNPNSSVEAAHQAFMNSDGHKANILKAAYTSVAIRIIEANGQYYIVEFFFG